MPFQFGTNDFSSRKGFWMSQFSFKTWTWTFIKCTHFFLFRKQCLVTNIHNQTQENIIISQHLSGNSADFHCSSQNNRKTNKQKSKQNNSQKQQAHPQKWILDFTNEKLPLYSWRQLRLTMLFPMYLLTPMLPCPKHPSPSLLHSSWRAASPRIAVGLLGVVLPLNHLLPHWVYCPLQTS